MAGGTQSQGVLALANAHGDVVGEFTAAGTSVAAAKAYDPVGHGDRDDRAGTGLPRLPVGVVRPGERQGPDGSALVRPGGGRLHLGGLGAGYPRVPDSAAANPYGYVQDEPLDLSDPSGHCFLVCSVASAVTSR